MVSSQKGFGKSPRLFDTANPGTVEHGDPDLGSPNGKCTGGGAGIGIGGEPGAPGENCSPLGYALIVQEKQEDVSKMIYPDDNDAGGIITFRFKARGTYVKDITLLDIDVDGAEIVVGQIKRGKGFRKRKIPVRNLGNNSVQTIRIKKASVKWIKVKFKEGGAVPSITFCRR